MVFKVAGKYSWTSIRVCSDPPRTDVSLAAFGRKEIEIAEVSSRFSVYMFRTRSSVILARNAGTHVHEAEGMSRPFAVLLPLILIFKIAVRRSAASEGRSYRWVLAHVS